MEEAVVIDAADVAGVEPAVFEDFFGFFGVVEVSGEDVGAFEADDALLADGELAAGDGIDDADGEAGEEVADGAVA